MIPWQQRNPGGELPNKTDFSFSNEQFLPANGQVEFHRWFVQTLSEPSVLASLDESS
jgi:hypothetical protein